MCCCRIIWSYFTKRIYLSTIAMFALNTCISFGRDLQTPTSNIAILTQNCIRNPTEPSTIFTETNPCNSAINCRYGGICWKTSTSPVSGRTVFHRDGPGKGVCRCTFHCPRYSRRSRSEHGEVCGNDGRTYDNECMLRLAACRCQYPITVKWKGTCEDGPKQIPHQKIATPSFYSFDEESSGSGDFPADCGEGTTCKFGAVCDLDSEDGPCLCKLDCRSTTSATVCGTDGRSYYNECYLKEESCHYQVYIGVDHEGPCANNPGTSKIPLIDGDDGSAKDQLMLDTEDGICSSFNCQGEVLKPVCGTGNRQFPNFCMLQYTACLEKKTIALLHQGFCDNAQIATSDNVNGDHADEDENETPNACDAAFCFGGAVCIPDGDHYRCSCDDICNKDLMMKPQKSMEKLRDLPSLRVLAVYLPDIRWYDEVKDFGGEEEKGDYFDEEYNVETLTVSSTTTATTTLRSRKRKRKDHVIETIDGVDDISPFRYLKKRKQENPDDVYHESNYKLRKQDWSRRFEGRNYNRRKRSADSKQSETFLNETLCGTDGKTYDNECQMKIYACHNRKQVKVHKKGACPSYYKPDTQKQKSLLDKSSSSSEEESALATTIRTKILEPTTDFSTVKQHSTIHTNIESKPDIEYVMEKDRIQDSTTAPLTDRSIEAGTTTFQTKNSFAPTNKKIQRPSLHLFNPTELKDSQNDLPQSNLPDSNTNEYPWVIAIVAATTVVIALLLALSFLYFSSTGKSSRKQGESDATTFDTIIVSSNEEKEVASTAPAKNEDV